MKPLSLVLFLSVSSAAFGAATFQIINNDAAGVGLNDATPVVPVGGNTGTTLGQQRLNVIQAAAQVWGATLTSSVPIQVRAQTASQACTATSATLASAGAISLFRDASGTVLPPANHWYNEAITNRLTGDDNSTNPDINMTINRNLGSSGGVAPAAGCGFTFYLGLDNNPPAGQTALLPVLLHELAHGLGFQTFTNGSTGAYQGGFPSKFDSMLFDTTRGLYWDQMTSAERAASALNSRKLVWTGTNTTAAVPSVLYPGTPELAIMAPSNIAGTYMASALQGAAPPYANLTIGGVTAEVMPMIDTVAGGTFTDGCEQPTGAAAASLVGKIALVDRGLCTFNVKLQNAMAVGAVGMIIVNNVAGTPPPMSGPDLTPAIPALIISQADGDILKSVLQFRSRTRSGLMARVGLNSNYSGADAAGRALMYAPNPFIAGSSISHFDPIMFRNQIMEPNASPGLTTNVAPPFDLTFPFLKDMGW